MVGFTIRPLLVGVFPRFEKSMLLLGTEPGTKIRVPCIAWLLEGGKGEKILVDTGPHAADAPTAHYHNIVEKAPDQRIDRALINQGVDPEEIKTVIFTHLHWDHCYDASLLVNASFYVQRKEIHYAINPIEWHKTAYEAGVPESRPAWFDVFHRMCIVDGDTEVIPGVSFVCLPGHTPGSAGVVVQTSRGACLLAGDTVPLQENWEGNARQRHIPSAMVTSMIDYYHSFKRMDTLVDFVVPSHDFRSFDLKY